MPNDLELLRQILADPEALEPRLRYAELLGESDARGEFIRTQIQRWKLYQVDPHETSLRGTYMTREQQLLARHGSEWQRHLDHLVDDVMFVRGFVEFVVMGASAFLSQAGDLYQLAPIRHLELTDAAALLADIAASPHLNRLVSLHLSGNDIDDAGVRLLANSKHLRKLQYLDLSVNRIGDAGMEALVASNRLGQVAYINLEGNPAESPVEGFGVDALSGQIVLEGCYLPPSGDALERKYGHRPWMHGPSLLQSYPPLIENL